MSGQSKWMALFIKFIENIRIVSKESVSYDKRGSPLVIWGSQKRFLEELCEGLDRGVRRFFCLKSRQLGITTICYVIDIWWLAVHDATLGAFVIDTEQNSATARETIKQYINSFPKSFFGKNFSLVKSNKNYMLFSNGSRLDFLVAGKSKKNWGESKGYSFAHISEISKYGLKEGIDNFMESLAENHPNRLFIFESTANGMNFWKDMYEDAGRDTITKKRMFIGFWAKELNRISRTDKRWDIYGTDDPTDEEAELIRQVKEKHGYIVPAEALAWYRWRQSDVSVSQETLNQNQPWFDRQAFVATGYSFFQKRLLNKQLSQIMDGNPETGEDPPIFLGYRLWLGNEFAATRPELITDPGRISEVELRIWEPPDPDGYYAVGCDPAMGRNDSKDRHCIQVYRCFADRIIQVAEYADNNVETRQCAWVLAYLCGIYENCIFSIELTGGHGRAVMTEIDYLKEKMQSEPVKEGDKDWTDFLSGARHYLWKKADSFTASLSKGFETTGRSKPEIMNQLRDSHSTGELVIKSGPLVAEMMQVIQDGYEIGAPSGRHDDRVFASALANRVWINDWRPRLTRELYTYQNYLDALEGKSPKQSQLIQGIVSKFFSDAEEEAENPLPSEDEAWMNEKGFV